MLDALPTNIPTLLFWGFQVMIIPVLGWGGNKLISLVKSSTITEIKLRDACRDIDTLKAGHNQVDSRVTKVEDAIQAIRESVQRRDEQFATITSKLDQLPRLAAMLEGLSATATAIVPRTEVESRLQASEKRLDLLEQDIRRAP